MEQIKLQKFAGEKNSMIETIKSLFARDLKKLKTEIELYQDETKLWYTEKNIANTAGNLCLHLIGNLNTYIGAGLGKTGYVRHRDLEFLQKDIPRVILLKKFYQTIAAVDAGLDNITEEQLPNDFPVLIWEQPSSIEYTLVHLTTHLAYHLGQINYHRRLLDM